MPGRRIAYRLCKLSVKCFHFSIIESGPWPALLVNLSDGSEESLSLIYCPQCLLGSRMRSPGFFVSREEGDLIGEAGNEMLVEFPACAEGVCFFR